LATAASAQGAFVPVRKEIVAPSGALALCLTYKWACATEGAPLTSAQADLAREVSRQVNVGIRAVTDEAQYGTAELWSLPSVRGGDCEDFALLKKRVLISRGLPANRLLIAAVLDRDGKSHAVLVLRTEEGDLVLDKLTDRVRDWRETGYTFVRMQDPEDPSRWVSVLAGGALPTSGRPV
jgi:predicted transglutaminase-like cysteine proteinase